MVRQKERLRKRGISPVIATMLLISIALLLAVIIFLWAKAFLEERIQKDLGGGPEPIESFCDEVNIAAEGFTTDKAATQCDGNAKGCSYVRVVNRGNIPVHGLEIREKKTEAGERVATSVVAVGTFSKKTSEGRAVRTIRIGEDATVVVYPDPTKENDGKKLTGNSKLLVTPIILGEKGTQYEAHVCDSEFAVEVPVKSLT